MDMHKRVLRVSGLVAVSVLALAVVAPSGAGARTKAAAKVTTVNVVVGDTSGTGGAMTMTVDPATAPAGKVKFVVKNEGTILHEMVVLKLKAGTTADSLVVNPKTNRISEAGSVGEVGNVPKGKTKSVTLKLKKGDYALVCNIAKHYGLGMRAGLTVS